MYSCPANCLVKVVHHEKSLHYEKSFMRKVLLVEDDSSLGTTLKERLSQDFEVFWAQTQKQAMQYLEKMTFDLMILDVGLPDGSGFDIAKKISLQVKTPILFLT